MLKKIFLIKPSYLVVTVLWLSIILVACNPTSESQTIADGQTVSIELPTQNSEELEESSNPITDEKPEEEEGFSVEEVNSSSVEEASEPETAISAVNSEESIAFQTIAQGDSLIAELTMPTILVAGNSEEADQFGRLFEDADISRQIESIDFSSKWLVLVFSGAADSSGYNISIETVQPIDGEVQLHVQQSEPDPDLMVSAVITYPYHIIEINKSDIPINSANLWTVYDAEGSLLTEVTYH